MKEQEIKRVCTTRPYLNWDNTWANHLTLVVWVNNSTKITEIERIFQTRTKYTYVFSWKFWIPRRYLSDQPRSTNVSFITELDLPNKCHQPCWSLAAISACFENERRERGSCLSESYPKKAALPNLLRWGYSNSKAAINEILWLLGECHPERIEAQCGFEMAMISGGRGYTRVLLIDGRRCRGQSFASAAGQVACCGRCASFNNKKAL